MNNKLNILFYGTCQSKGIKDVLNLSENYYIQYHIQCYSTNISKEDFNNILNICDIIITQPIPDNYRDKDYLSTTYIINNCKKDCKVLIYQRQYFNFYYYNTIYYKFKDDVLHIPNDYHYGHMIEYYKKNKNVDDFMNEIVFNMNLKSKDDLESIANESIQYLVERDKDIVNKYIKNTMNLSKHSEDKELLSVANAIDNTSKSNILYVSVVQYIKDNYKNKLLFYSMNHPTKVLLQYVAQEIVTKLNLKNSINYQIDPLNEPKCIIYSCIQNALNFNIFNENVQLCDKHDIKSIVNLYYDTYNSIKLE
jgi:hypothetical protein